MYLEFFGLKEEPFSLSPDTRFMYLTQEHKEALARALLTIDRGRGLFVIYGDIGTGKTMLSVKLLEELRLRDYKVGLIPTPSFNTENQLLKEIIREFELEEEGRSKPELMGIIHSFLIKSFDVGDRIVLMIDEAQGLSRGMLEVLRLLLNFETKSGKMLQLVLIGQNELRDNVRAKANLRSRVAAAATLDNLMYEDVRDLIYHRLRVSGATHNRTFPEPIIQQIYTASRGIPRDISIIADAALMRAYLSGKKIIDENILEAALRDWEAA